MPTDGVIEAHDPAGALYPLTERISDWHVSTPEDFLRRLRRDLIDHVGGQLRDDVAMIAIKRSSAAAV
ncbi:SpoIIE family protein phosphatase [Streptomyces luteolus]|uniref:SpoIIE family protein phosphatase n=1 Tax=Streptomyces luteolus TaxID=3043615 RepID=A0ABT6T3V0_9ACTN|nr:SpoIIE family protein phosphatase [Streptomyces sp. B-S-A12]MDI3422539.1 SpoIIE family protein phosphatase [Streptomyces sp. B-S-A12]